MRTNLTISLLLFSALLCVVIAEERLSWFTTDEKIKKSIFVPDDLPEGKEENRVLPWVFHDEEETKLIQLKCIMRGYNASNNPSSYKNAKWSHPGFEDSQIDTSAPAAEGDENGVRYRIWTIEINTSAADAGKKWATCEFQQGDFPLSTEFKFLIFRRLPKNPLEEGNKVLLSYDLGGSLDEKDINQQIEDDIKRQISQHYSMPASKVIRSQDSHKFLLKVPADKADPLADVNDTGLTTLQVTLIIILVLFIVSVSTFGGIMAHKEMEKIRASATASI